eukprot:6203986-Pleurochrysis_carterae.AAC.4
MRRDETAARRCADLAAVVETERVARRQASNHPRPATTAAAQGERCCPAFEREPSMRFFPRGLFCGNVAGKGGT